MPSVHAISSTLGEPRVSVPVLSNNTALTVAALSRYCPPLTKTPALADRPNAATVAVGAANIKAQGHPTISTATARLISPVIIQAMAAQASMTGVNQVA